MTRGGSRVTHFGNWSFASAVIATYEWSLECVMLSNRTWGSSTTIRRYSPTLLSRSASPPHQTTLWRCRPTWEGQAWKANGRRHQVRIQESRFHHGGDTQSSWCPPFCSWSLVMIAIDILCQLALLIAWKGYDMGNTASIQPSLYKAFGEIELLPVSTLILLPISISLGACAKCDAFR